MKGCTTCVNMLSRNRTVAISRKINAYSRM
jgi:hypothetical protein